jgi:hypothetical protein
VRKVAILNDRTSIGCGFYLHLFRLPESGVEEYVRGGT